MPHGSAENSNNEADGKAGAAAEAEARRLEELASDPVHGGKITPGSMREAQVAFGLEKAGRLPGPVTRDPTGAADFIDGRGVEWDVKSFNSNFQLRRREADEISVVLGSIGWRGRVR